MWRAMRITMFSLCFLTLPLSGCLLLGSPDGSDSWSSTGAGDGNSSSCVRDDPAGSSCNAGEDCMVTCMCTGGSVDSGSCVNWRCASADDSCTEACPNMGKGNYKGDFCAIAASSSSSSNNNSSSSGRSIGETCEFNSDCSSYACLVVGGASFGYCTTTCSDWSDCPDGWDCEAVGNASALYCHR